MKTNKQDRGFQGCPTLNKDNPPLGQASTSTDNDSNEWVWAVIRSSLMINSAESGRWLWNTSRIMSLHFNGKVKFASHHSKNHSMAADQQPEGAICFHQSRTPPLSKLYKHCELWWNLGLWMWHWNNKIILTNNIRIFPWYTKFVQTLRWFWYLFIFLVTRGVVNHEFVPKGDRIKLFSFEVLRHLW